MQIDKVYTLSIAVVVEGGAVAVPTLRASRIDGVGAAAAVAASGRWAQSSKVSGGGSGKGGEGGISRSRRAVYISPSKALCEERYMDWSRRLAEIDPGLKVAQVTGDAGQGSYRDIASAHVIVTTPMIATPAARK